MKYLFYILVGVTLFFALSTGHITPAIVVNHDKIAHFVVFFVLSFCMNISFPTNAFRNLIIVMILFAVSIEFVQYLLANRELSITDFGASVAGVFAYVIIRKMIGKKYKIVKGTSNAP